MKKLRKDRVILLGVILAIILAVIITLVVIKSVKGPEIAETPTIFALPDTTYSDMEVKNVEMEYLKDNDQTMITMDINNTTEAVVEGSNFNAIWLNENGEIIAKIPTLINALQPGEECSVSVILNGDLTKTTAIKLQEK